MCRICWLSVIVLLAVMAAMVYVLLLRGEVREAEDGRTAILLSPAERALVLGEMRAFLEGVQQILAATTTDDASAAVAAARRVGRVNLNDLPPSLLRKLPMEVKALGLDTHRAFQQLAEDMAGGLDREKTLARLGDILLNCTTCHAGYRIDTQPRGQ